MLLLFFVRVRIFCVVTFIVVGIHITICLRVIRNARNFFYAVGLVIKVECNDLFCTLSAVKAGVLP